MASGAAVVTELLAKYQFEALLVVAWFPLTLWLHILIHEGAHWLALRAFGYEARVYPYPHKRNGRWVWGWTSWGEADIPLRQVLAISAAPMVAELAWAVVALSVALVWPWAALEAAAALVDVVVGWGLLRRAEGTDARRVLDLLR